MRRISSDSPEFEMAITTSPAAIMPRSPWLASPGCMKNAGVPVEAMVEAIFPPTWPDFPMPVTTTRPLASRIVATAARKLSPSRPVRRNTAAASISSTSFASALCALSREVLADVADLPQGKV